MTDKARIDELELQVHCEPLKLVPPPGIRIAFVRAADCSLEIQVVDEKAGRCLTTTLTRDDLDHRELDLVGLVRLMFEMVAGVAQPAPRFKRFDIRKEGA